MWRWIARAIYIADAGNRVIRKVSMVNGQAMIFTEAGSTRLEMTTASPSTSVML